MTRRYSLYSALLVGLLLPLACLPAQAQSEEAPPPADPTSEAQRMSAREKRIEEYLRRKEQKRAVREQEQLERAAAAEQALELEKQQLAEQAAEAEAAAAAAAAAPPASPPQPPPSRLPRNLAEVQAALRLTPMAQEPSVRAYLDLIDRQQASPQQLAAFGSFLAESGMNRLALVYYDLAVKLDPRDPSLWVNLGTLYRQLNEMDKAKSAFSRALNINPATAVAHYNLGAIFDIQGKYQRALEAYRIALTLDPSLGDPAFNPSAANNERLLAVKLMLYKDQAGNIGPSLVDVTGGSITGIAPLTENESDE
jgi:tetratricopeptide (TPR) repeat protein